MNDGSDITLVLGGARSGKTRRALSLTEQRCRDAGSVPVYVATAQAFDDEMADRIHNHQAERGDHWRTVEAPLDLAGAISANAGDRSVLLIDCLTLWLSNTLLAERDVDVAVQGLCTALRAAAGPVIVVSNEVGYGIVPENALARRFRDEQGRLNQMVAGLAARVELVAAGLPLTLKG
ncbi:MAG: bifunctional adenosylcobinamide kinase/adenosylcobinamide-phosphate guanylyltransferase [Alphaproteobacteria bacterium]